MIFKINNFVTEPLRLAINNAYRIDEAVCVEHLLNSIHLTDANKQDIERMARHLVTQVREVNKGKSGIDAFMLEYDLSSHEGIAIMCLAEALLRVPDKETVDLLIRDKLSMADWQAHLGNSESFTVNATTWALILTGKVLGAGKQDSGSSYLPQIVRNVISRSGEPMIRKAIAAAMKIMSRQFVMGRTIEEALSRARHLEKRGFRYSYDMLGEAALTAEDAERYFNAYQAAILACGKTVEGRDLINAPGISIKLSALHPRYEFAQRERVMDELVPKLFSLACDAKESGIGLTIDAEEANRLDLSLDIFEAVFADPGLENWNGFGLALQSYQKRAFYVIDWLVALAQHHKRRIPVRLIKGAYWDSEIKMSQMMGFSGYPVFTRKQNTDISFLACAQKILGVTDHIYPQFATHNAYSVATILALVGTYRDFEFQCLHGMGQALYDAIVGTEKIPCRIYAPVGSHSDLLPYLVRRLLENGANTSFVNRLVDAKAPIESLIVDPAVEISSFASIAHPKIPLPHQIFGSVRSNSQGVDLSDRAFGASLAQELEAQAAKQWRVGPCISGHESTHDAVPVYSPSDRDRVVGFVQEANKDEVENALNYAAKAVNQWQGVDVDQRAHYLETAANLLEKHRNELVCLLILEAGKTFQDAFSEIREATDFCRYYAVEARRLFAQPQILPGYTGEYNHLEYHGRGVIVCISPWNFPVAIFTGQVVAALAAGNTVIAKPAEQTPLLAGLVIRIFHAAGIPADVLQLLPGKGESIGPQLLNDPAIAGVLFTGSTETAAIINKTLANRPGPIVPLLAETGGQNAMIVDSSALPEQVVKDVVLSAFGSAGQRCSALRVLFLQEEIAQKIINMLKGAMMELSIGNPCHLSTDVGPVIDEEAKTRLNAHLQYLESKGTLIYQCALSEAHQQGYFVPPTAYQIPSLSVLPNEVFGPILHVIVYKFSELDSIIQAINNTGYGLTFGIHSRINEKALNIQRQVRAGNCYVNRNMIGAVVGVQPFGGEGLSGTGPKAGGPNYLLRLCHERVLTIDTTASGGNASLMSLNES